MQPPFDALDGVTSTQAGYTGGHVANPTYQKVSAGGTGHREAVRVFYDPSKVSYDKLLEVFWQNIDPEDNSGQFCDRGEQYRAAIYYHTEEEKRLAEQSRIKIQETTRMSKIATDILPATKFYPAEDYHQEFYRKHPYRYELYRSLCGRDKRLEAVWGGKPSH